MGLWEGLQWLPKASMHLHAPPPIDAARSHIENGFSIPLKKGGTNQCNVVLHPIVWDFGRMIQVHRFAHNV